MLNQFEQSDKSLTSLLQQSYNNAFSETPSYNFVAPTAAKLPSVIIDRKQQHCLSCGSINEIEYINYGHSYADHEHLVLQQSLHDKFGLVFPPAGNTQEFVYQQEGYCLNCFPATEQSLTTTGQSIYKLCSQLVGADSRVITDITRLLDEDKDIHDYLDTYRKTSENLITEIKVLLDEIVADDFDAYVGRPMNMLDSLCSKMFNEYTILVPIQDTPEDYFFIKSSIKKQNVLTFLQLPRINTVEQVRTELTLTNL